MCKYYNAYTYIYILVYSFTVSYIYIYIYMFDKFILADWYVKFSEKIVWILQFCL